jgi:hypothetical protein
MPRVREQARRTCAHLERVLLVCGLQNSGKSHLLRAMYNDPRFGTRGRVPTGRQAILPPVTLSYARKLFVRLSSPHETNQSLSKFLNKIERFGERAWNEGWRFNFACAVQPHQTPTTPDVMTICQELYRCFLPERIRLVQIDPLQNGDASGDLLRPAQLRRLWSLRDPVEVVTLSAERIAQDVNGSCLADYFDFT